MPHIRPVAHGSRLPLYDVAATRRIETEALAGRPNDALIRQAGLSVAQLAMAIAPHGPRVWVACGPGNNGADGLEAARHLQAWGKQVFVTTLVPGQPDDQATGRRLQQAVDAGVTWMPTPPDHVELCIDAILGLGCQARPLDGRLAAWIDRIHAQRQTVLSVDLPTGLHPETGCAAKGSVVADHTLCLLTLKPGLFTADGRDLCGRVWLDDLGTLSTEIDATNARLPTAWLTGEPRPGVRLHASHKGSYGDVGVVGGSRGMTGAALLAASAALHAGAGRVFVSLLDSQAPSVPFNQPELMLRPIDLLAIEHMAVVCGCGGGDQIADLLPKLLADSRALVLDADGLNAVATNPKLGALLRQRSDRSLATVITPHPLEAARLIGTSTQELQRNRLGAAQELAQRFLCTVVLKGSGTVISSPGEVPLINPTGNSRLASAGTGDVLAGMIGAGLAQGHGTTRAAADAVFRHGQVADEWPTRYALTASRLGSAAQARPSTPGFSAAL